MKPWVWQVPLFLFLGAVVTAIVAGVLATRFVGPGRSVLLWDAAAAAKGWPVEVPASWGPPNIWSQYTYVGHDCTSVVTGASFGESGPTKGYSGGDDVTIERAGWPVRAFRSIRYGMFEGSDAPDAPINGYDFVSWRIGIMESRPTAPYWGSGQGQVIGYIPTMPVPLGLAADSATYGLTIWTLVFGKGTVQRAVRSRRGLCPHCAYPIGTSPVCSECGKPVKPRTVAAA